MHKMQTRTNRHRQRGSTLLEVLIAVLILAIGMLGMAAMQMMTLKNTNSSAGRSQAVVMTYSLFDILRLDRAAAIGGAYNGEHCEADGSAVGVWLQGVRNNLGDPEACGSVQCAADSCTVTINWDDSRATGGEAFGPMQVETSSRL